ncbi:MAG: hypothetical protein IPI51_06830 [Betaproteobacteria bacterium]|jgi:hypothetical protein|nr:hypothetical protein [Betaproteobacteria bacterium]
MNDPTLLQLRMLTETVAALAEENRHLQRRLLERDDRRAGLVLWPLAHELVGERPFTGPGLLQAALNTRTAVGQAVRELIVEAADGAGGMRAFGRMLQRLQGVPLSGFRLVPSGESREGLRWRLVQVSGE